MGLRNEALGIAFERRGCDMRRKFGRLGVGEA